MGGQEGCRFTSSKPNSKQMKSDQRTMGPVRAVTVCDVTSGVVRVTVQFCDRGTLRVVYRDRAGGDRCFDPPPPLSSADVCFVSCVESVEM